MENSENKSLISTGGSNLAKTEKLLSITKKILSEIKPQYESVRIGNQEWMTRNLDVDRFRNGDFIPHIESDEEWKEAGENGQPAWCYYDNDPENGKKYGKLYNWFAVNDSKGLAPEGWHIPSDDEWTSLVEYLGGIDIAGHKMTSVEDWKDWEESYGKIKNVNGDNSSGFNALPGGFRSDNKGFGQGKKAFFWSTTEFNFYYAWFRSLTYYYDLAGRYYGSNSKQSEFSDGWLVGRYPGSPSKKNGFSIRCLRDDFLFI